ncbi:hypothetical protein MBLNU459_g1510t1 [Dothideomycetes sp. NU459]
MTLIARVDKSQKGSAIHNNRIGVGRIYSQYRRSQSLSAIIESPRVISKSLKPVPEKTDGTFEQPQNKLPEAAKTDTGHARSSLTLFTSHPIQSSRPQILDLQKRGWDVANSVPLQVLGRPRTVRSNTIGTFLTPQTDESDLVDNLRPGEPEDITNILPVAGTLASPLDSVPILRPRALHVARKYISQHTQSGSCSAPRRSYSPDQLRPRAPRRSRRKSSSSDSSGGGSSSSPTRPTTGIAKPSRPRSPLRGPRPSPPHNLRSSVQALRRMNSDLQGEGETEAGSGEQRYLKLGREASPLLLAGGFTAAEKPATGWKDSSIDVDARTGGGGGGCGAGEDDGDPGDGVRRTTKGRDVGSRGAGDAHAGAGRGPQTQGECRDALSRVLAPLREEDTPNRPLLRSPGDRRVVKREAEVADAEAGKSAFCGRGWDW